MFGFHKYIGNILVKDTHWEKNMSFLRGQTVWFPCERNIFVLAYGKI
jgi:hypothetical protein